VRPPVYCTLYTIPCIPPIRSKKKSNTHTTDTSPERVNSFARKREVLNGIKNLWFINNNKKEKEKRGNFSIIFSIIIATLSRIFQSKQAKFLLNFLFYTFLNYYYLASLDRQIDWERERENLLKGKMAIISLPLPPPGGTWRPMMGWRPFLSVFEGWFSAQFLSEIEKMWHFPF